MADGEFARISSFLSSSRALTPVIKIDGLYDESIWKEQPLPACGLGVEIVANDGRACGV